MLHIQFPEITFPVHDLDKVTIPRMVRIRQNYARDRIEDIPGQLDLEFSKHDYAASVRGKRIAVTVGSRGIPDNAAIVRSICQHLKAWGAEPFIVPAMGSHGGGTAEGNLEILAGYRITEENIGECTFDEAKAWVIANWVDIMKTDSNSVNIVFFNGDDICLISISENTELNEFMESDELDTGMEIDLIHDLFTNSHDDVYLCSPAALP